MMPSSRYFPSSLQDRAAWFQNFATQFGSLATALGFLPAEITIVNADNDGVQFAASANVELDAFINAFRQYRNSLLEGTPGEPTPSYPNNPLLVQPGVIAAGIFERLDVRVKRIRLSPTYTTEIGAMLGILPNGTNAPQPADEMQPTLKLAAMPNSVVNASFKRGLSDGVIIEIKIDNAAAWSDAGIFPKSPAKLAIPPNADGLPRAVQVRARYVEGNDPVGLFSPVVSTATQPQS